MTTNDIELLRVDNITAATSGLITAAGVSPDGFTLSPDNFPPGVHARVLWVTPAGTVRILEPIALSTVDNDRSGRDGFWNPLRTGATFFAPLQGAVPGLATTVYFVCPNTNIQAPDSTAKVVAVPSSRATASPRSLLRSELLPGRRP